MPNKHSVKRRSVKRRSVKRRSVKRRSVKLRSVKRTLKNTNPCWKGYYPVGTKQKGGRTVPNCVPK